MLIGWLDVPWRRSSFTAFELQVSAVVIVFLAPDAAIMRGHERVRCIDGRR